MEKNCPHCGAPLPQEAAFCPHCAQSVNRRNQAKVPVPFPWRKALRVGLPLLVVIGLLLGWYLCTRPRIYDDGGTATVTYTDRDGSYQLLQDSLAKEDYEEAFRAAHTIKGVCQNLAFDKLGNSSEHLT